MTTPRAGTGLLPGIPIRTGTRVLIDGAVSATVRAVSTRYLVALVTPDGSTDDVRVNLDRLTVIRDA